MAPARYVLDFDGSTGSTQLSPERVGVAYATTAHLSKSVRTTNKAVALCVLIA